jgi:small subunit ribosomal protein S18
MSEELNPTPETTETTEAVEIPTAEAPAENAVEAASVEAPTDEAATDNQDATDTAVAEPAAPAAPSASAEAPAAPQPAATASGPNEFVPEAQGGGRSRRTQVDAQLSEIHYKNVTLLSRFIDPRGRILSRRKTRVSAKMQRKVVQAIKLARHLALLPYTADQTRVVRKRR